MWLQDAGVDAVLRGDGPSFDESMNSLESSAAEFRQKLQGAKSPISSTNDHQAVLSDASQGLNIVYRSPTSALISVDELHFGYLDRILPRFVSPIALPTEPRSFVPVPKRAIKRVAGLLEGLKFSPEIASIVSSLSVLGMQKDIRHLTGEDGEGILSRHSFSQGARVAASWIQAQIEETGASCRQENFLRGYSPNVIWYVSLLQPEVLSFANLLENLSRYPSTVNTTALVLLSAHYDSRGSFGSTRAPGANDDGSGVTHLLAIARAIKSNGVTFKSNVELVAFAGEEQGLLGSKAYARALFSLLSRPPT